MGDEDEEETRSLLLAASSRLQETYSQSFFLSVCLSIYLSVYLSFYLLSVYQSVENFTKDCLLQTTGNIQSIYFSGYRSICHINLSGQSIYLFKIARSFHVLKLIRTNNSSSQEVILH